MSNKRVVTEDTANVFSHVKSRQNHTHMNNTQTIFSKATQYGENI